MRASAQRRHVRVAIVGAGLGGIATAVKLKQAGVPTFTVFERSSGPGGVWWQNTYPGCEVDVASLAYSYSFMPYDWARTHATQPQLLAYVQDVIDHFGIRGNFRFDTEVTSVRWDDHRRVHRVCTAGGDEQEFDVVVSCVGMLSHPQLPDWPGLDRFEGPVFHTANFEHDHDLSAARVAVVGTGSTACQLVPALAPIAKQINLFQREPGWVMPKRVREFTDAERSRYRRHGLRRRIDRLNLFRMARKDSKAYRASSRRQQELRDYSLAYIAKTVQDEQVREAVTPGYAYGCKRPVLAGDFYTTLNEPHVALIPHAVTEVTPTGLVDDTGTHREADVLILATGFQATRYLATVDVYGRGGAFLQDVWAGAPWAFLGVTVPGFPNFFILYGPNTNGGWSVIVQLELQAELVVREVRRLARGRGTVVDTRPGVATRYDRWVQNQIAKRLTAASAGCRNYYHAESGKNVTQWPRSHATYLALTRLLPRFGLVTTTERVESEAPQSVRPS